MIPGCLVGMPRKRQLLMVNDAKSKKPRRVGEEPEEETKFVLDSGTKFTILDDDLLFEVLKHTDAKTLGRAACVNKQWQKTVQDERIWEMICAAHWPAITYGDQQLRSVVLPLGGFRSLLSQYLGPLFKPHSASVASTSSPTSSVSFRPASGLNNQARWGKDELHLSLSLLSIQYFGKLNFTSGRSLN